MRRQLAAMAMIIVMNSAALSQTRTIQGTITGDAGKPLPTADVILLKAGDSSVIAMEKVNESGAYKVMYSYTGSVLLKVEASGYKYEIKAPVEGSAASELSFVLAAEKGLKEVVISGRKPLIEEKADRTIFNVENSIAATSGDAVDALRRTPGVQVMNNDITMAGKGSVSVMINGRMQQLSGSDLLHMLHSIPSGNLSKIEVISSPSSRYDAEGNSGIINLVTKKNLKNGWKGNVTAGYLLNSLGNPTGSASVSYKKDKLNLFCNTNIGRPAEKYTNRTTSYSGADRWEQIFYQYSYEKDAGVQLGAEYILSRKHTVGIQLNEQYSRSDNNDNSEARAYRIGSDMLDSVIRTNGTSSDYLKGRHALNMNYEWRIDSAGRKLNIDADYYTQAMQRNRSFFTQGYAGDWSKGSGSDNTMGASPAIFIRSAKADMEWPLHVVMLSFGGKTAMIDNSSYNEYKLYNGSDFIVDTTRTNEFAYHEETQALYANGQRSIGKMDMQAGLRSEWTTMETYSATTGERHKTSYQQFFPSGYLQYKINDNNVVSINYSRRINRPGYSSLNPFRLYFGPNFYSKGNPALKPSFSNGMELSYRLKGHYSFKIFGKQTDGYWDRLFENDAASGATVATRANIGKAQQCGVNIAAQMTIKKWWEARGSVNAGYGRYRLHYYQAETTLAMVNQWFDMNHTFFLNKNKTLSAEVSAYYYTPRQKDYKIWADMSTIGGNLRMLLMDKNLIIVLRVEDVMAKAYWRQTNVFNGTNEYSYDNARGVQLSLTYKFGNKNVKMKQNDHSSEEIQRVNQ